jgi:hypothetical protein
MIKMKLKIMIMALLLLAGIGSAVNWLPESTMEPGANLSYYDSGSSLQTFDFSTEPADGSVLVSISGIWSVLAGKYLDGDIVIGPASDTYSFLYDYTTDGVDDCIEIQDAIDNIGTHGDIVFEPGIYNLTNTIYCRPGARLLGKGNVFHSWPLAEHVETDPDPIPRRVTFQITNETEPAFEIPDGRTGITIENIAFYYPDQSVDSVVEYPATILGSDWYSADITLRNLLAINPYIFLYMPRADRITIDNVKGAPIKTGIYIGQASDVPYIRHVHFSPQFLEDTELEGSASRIYRYQHGTAFHLGRLDWPSVIDIFAFGYKYGIYMNTTRNGRFTGIGLDVCEYPIYMHDSSENIISGGQLVQCSEYIGVPHPGDGAAIEIHGGSNNIIIGNVIRYKHAGIIDGGTSTIKEHNRIIAL